LLNGIVEGYALRQQLLNWKNQNEAYKRKAALEDQEASIQEIVNRQMLQENARPVTNGTVQDTLNAIAPSIQRRQGTPGPAGAPPADSDTVTADQVSNLPQSRTTVNPGSPATTILRKADRSRTVTYQDRQGNKSQHELLTPEEQDARKAAAAKAKFQATAIPMTGPNGETVWMDPAHVAAYYNATSQWTPTPTTLEQQNAGVQPTVPAKMIPAAIGAVNNAVRVENAGERNEANIASREGIAGKNMASREGMAGRFEQMRRDIAAGVQTGANKRAAGVQAGLNGRRNQPTEGQAGVQNRFQTRQETDLQKQMRALQTKEDELHATRVQIGEDLNNPDLPAIQRQTKQGQLKTTAFQIQSYQTRKAALVGAEMPPKKFLADVDKTYGTKAPGEWQDEEGNPRTINGPDGHTWRKTGGIVYFVK
jgi:hypothetical protein